MKSNKDQNVRREHKMQVMSACKFQHPHHSGPMPFQINKI